MLAIYINAGNDRNGNPRRGWLISDGDGGPFRDFVDEGYQGREPLRKLYGDVPTTSQIEVSPSVYRDAYRQAYGKIEEQMKRENKLRRAGRR